MSLLWGAIHWCCCCSYPVSVVKLLFSVDTVAVDVVADVTTGIDIALTF